MALPIELLMILLTASGILMAISIRLGVAVLVLIATVWLAGFLYPFVAHTVGLSQPTLGQFLSDALHPSSQTTGQLAPTTVNLVQRPTVAPTVAPVRAIPSVPSTPMPTSTPTPTPTPTLVPTPTPAPLATLPARLVPKNGDFAKFANVIFTLKAVRARDQLIALDFSFWNRNDFDLYISFIDQFGNTYLVDDTGTKFNCIDSIRYYNVKPAERVDFTLNFRSSVRPAGQLTLYLRTYCDYRSCDDTTWSPVRIPTPTN